MALRSKYSELILWGNFGANGGVYGNPNAGGAGNAGGAAPDVYFFPFSQTTKKC